MTNIIFPRDSYNASGLNLIDIGFHSEVSKALNCGFNILTVDLYDLAHGITSIRGEAGEGPTLYRGWIIPSDHYALLETAMKVRGKPLLNNLHEYNFSYKFPLWYNHLKECTIPSIYFPGVDPDIEATIQQIQQEKGRSLIIKDYIKSQKYYWHEACYIPDSTDTENLRKVINKFIYLQSPLVGGLVFKDYLEFKKLGKHDGSDFPLIQEFRAFVFNGEILQLDHMWLPDYQGEKPFQFLAEVCRKLKGRNLLSVDVGQLEDGSWKVIEIGDGGVSSVPNGKTEEFYKTLASFCKNYMLYI